MPDAPALAEAVLEVVSPENTRRSVPLTQLPFCIGRGEVGNHLAIPDRRISRNCAVIHCEGDQYVLEDRGNQLGVFVNGERTTKRNLQEGDVVTFGLENSYQIIFHPSAPEITVENLLTRMGRISSTESSPVGLGKLNLLLEATMLLHSQLPLDAVLEAMLDRAITITNAERGLLLEADSDGTLLQRLARRAGGVSMPTEGFAPTQTALRMAIDTQTGVITGDLQQADVALQGAQSIIAQRLRSIVAIPLYAMPRANYQRNRSFTFSAGNFWAFCISIRGAPRPFPNSIARFSTPWPSKPPAFWTMRASWSANASASASSRN